jgi:hypothetical protein
MMYHHESCQCDVCKIPHFERNNYFHGKTLSARDLAAEQQYFNEKRWLINRAILGWGIVCGLDVCLEGSCLQVLPGMALDCCGRELLVCERETLHVRKIAEELNADPECNAQVHWALCLEYGECRTEQVNLPPSCEQKERGREYNRIRDGYRLSIRHRKDACPEDHSHNDCPDPKLGRTSSLQQALVKKSRECPHCKDCECVLLATGTLTTQPKQEPQLCLDTDRWKYRRLVYTNPSLASLIRCFHEGLAHIQKFSWEPGAHYGVETFLDLLGKGLEATFDHPMTSSTVTNPRTCRLSVFLPHDGGCPTQFLIPVERIEYSDPAAHYCFNYECIKHEIRDHCKRRDKPVDVELILHGSMILDKNGRALDAELIKEFPTGNGIEGGEFVAYFTVGPN